jgi:hypothetical protein
MIKKLEHAMGYLGLRFAVLVVLGVLILWAYHKSQNLGREESDVSA